MKPDKKPPEKKVPGDQPRLMTHSFHTRRAHASEAKKLRAILGDVTDAEALAFATDTRKASGAKAYAALGLATLCAADAHIWAAGLVAGFKGDTSPSDAGVQLLMNAREFRSKAEALARSLKGGATKRRPRKTPNSEALRLALSEHRAQSGGPLDPFIKSAVRRTPGSTVAGVRKLRSRKATARKPS